MAQVYSQCPQPFPQYDCGCSNTSQCRNTVGDCSSCLGVKTCFLNIKVFERILVDTRHKSISLKKRAQCGTVSFEFVSNVVQYSEVWQRHQCDAEAAV